MHSDLHKRLVSIFSDVFQIELDPNIEDISSKEIQTWDSFNKLRLVLELEQTFDISLSDEEVEGLASLHRAEALMLKYGVTSAMDMNGTGPERSAEEPYGSGI